jgi:hypothetical protein
MKEYLIRTKRESCAVSINVTTDGSSVPFYIVGYDPLVPFTYYFRSWFLINGQEEIVLNLPQSPRFLKIVAWTDEGYRFQIPAMKLIPLERPVVDDPIIVFIEKFSRYAGSYWPGYYYGESVPFVIQVSRRIWAENGKIHPTPARISVSEPIIEVSQEKFRELSIPERVIILLHETAHNYINSDPDNEVEADDNGFNIYQSLGYPKIEAMSAFAGIMADTDNNYQRMLNLINR